uniref:Uncharacterized protein n=1 Tax=Peronospora matthiolae TaxID=2874970 RepID=A0AAV1TXR1_9STRA
MLEDERNLQQWLANREDIHADHSIGVLREKICKNAWNVDRLCYVHVHESCYSCDSTPRPTRETWQRHDAEYPLSEFEQLCIGRYERSLMECKTAINRGASRWRHHSRPRGRGATCSPRRSSSRGRRLNLNQASSRTRKPERRLERLKEAKSAAPTYPARVETRANVHDTCARLEPRAHGVTTISFCDEDPRDPISVPRSSASDPPRPQAVVGPRDVTAGVLVAQDDVDTALNKAVDAQLEAEAAFDRSARAERAASETRQSYRELLERMRNLERQDLGHAQAGTQPDSMSLASRARREGSSTYEPLTPRTDPTREA